MKKIIGGLIAIILAFFCFSAFFPAFLTVMAGTIPLMLIIIGCLTIYLKRESDSPECGEAAACWDNTRTAEAVEPKSAEDGTPKFLGNTGTLVFHSTDCNFSKSKKCTAVFNTREEAIQGHYKPCGSCNP